MEAFLKVVAWSVAGACAASGLTFVALSVFFWTASPAPDGDSRGFQELAVVMATIGAAPVGLIVGAIYGVARRTRSSA